MNTVRTRIAPSPTGIAHIGTAYIALFNYAFAKKRNGDFIIRIEDTDRARFVKGAEQVIYDSLKWLSIPYAEGGDLGGPHAPYRQSERLPIYKRAALELVKNGHAYYCFCAPETLTEIREGQLARKIIPRYDRRCLKLSKEDIEQKLKNNERCVVRMKMPENEVISWEDLVRGKVEINTKELDDQILLKSDGFPTYHLAVVIDDNLMQITHIIRGEEWISSTPKHILLYRYFGFSEPQFAHMPLLRNPDKSKMSKRKNDVSIPSYREKGFIPEAVRNYLCLLGWSHPEEKEIFTLEEFVEKFSIDRVRKTAPIFDISKLTWMNGVYIREKSDEELIKILKEFYKDDKDVLKVLSDSFIAKGQLIGLVKTRMSMLTDFKDLMFDEKREIRSEKEAEIISELSREFKQIPEENWNKDEIFKIFKKIMTEHAIKMNMLYYIFTGKEKGLPLPETLEVLGKEKAMDRLG